MTERETPQQDRAALETEAGKALMRFMGWGPAWAKKIRAIEREAAAPGAAALDVERLVTAMVNVSTWHEILRSTPTAEAQLVAAEYQRLGARAAEPKPPESGDE